MGPVFQFAAQVDNAVECARTELIGRLAEILRKLGHGVEKLPPAGGLVILDSNEVSGDWWSGLKRVGSQ